LNTRIVQSQINEIHAHIAILNKFIELSPPHPSDQLTLTNLEKLLIQIK